MLGDEDSVTSKAWNPTNVVTAAWYVQCSPVKYLVVTACKWVVY